MNAISGHDMYQEGEMCDEDMLDIYIPETIKLLLSLTERSEERQG